MMPAEIPCSVYNGFILKNSQDNNDKDGKKNFVSALVYLYFTLQVYFRFCFTNMSFYRRISRAK